MEDNMGQRTKRDYNELPNALKEDSLEMAGKVPPKKTVTAPTLIEDTMVPKWGERIFMDKILDNAHVCVMLYHTRDLNSTKLTVGLVKAQRSIPTLQTGMMDVAELPTLFPAFNVDVPSLIFFVHGIRIGTYRVLGKDDNFNVVDWVTSMSKVPLEKATTMGKYEHLLEYKKTKYGVADVSTLRKMDEIIKSKGTGPDMKPVLLGLWESVEALARKEHLRLLHIFDHSIRMLYTEYDRVIRIANVFNLSISILSMIVMMAAYTVGYDRKEGTFERTSTVEALKLLNSFCTILLVLGLVILYRARTEVESHRWTATVSIFDSKIFPPLLLEILFCLIHPIPFVGLDTVTFKGAHEEFDWQLFNDELGLVQGFRFYLIFRVLRDYSLVYQHRKEIMIAKMNDKNFKEFYQSSGSDKFDWFLTLKLIFHDYPFLFTCGAWMVALLVSAFQIYVAERQLQFDDDFSFEVAVWNVIVTMTTVGYGDFSAQSRVGRFYATVSMFFGMMLTAALTAMVLARVTATKHEEFVTSWVHLSKLQSDMDTQAARLIQSVWRHGKKGLRTRAIDENSYKLRLRTLGLLMRKLEQKKLLTEADSASKDDATARLQSERLGSIEMVLADLSDKVDLLMGDRHPENANVAAQRDCLGELVRTNSLHQSGEGEQSPQQEQGPPITEPKPTIAKTATPSASNGWVTIGDKCRKGFWFESQEEARLFMLSLLSAPSKMDLQQTHVSLKKGRLVEVEVSSAGDQELQKWISHVEGLRKDRNGSSTSR